jgi:hypothetical protein
MEKSEYMKELVNSLKESVGESLQSVALGDVQSLDFEIAYMTEEAEEFMSREDRLDAFKSIAVEEFFETGESNGRGPMGDLMFTDRVYENAIIIVGWLGEGTDEIVVVAVDTDVNLIPKVMTNVREDIEYE